MANDSPCPNFPPATSRIRPAIRRGRLAPRRAHLWRPHYPYPQMDRHDRGRVPASSQKELLMKTSGTIKTETRNRNAWSRMRTCDCCGKPESVRKDNTSTTCKSCAARKAGAIGLVTIQARAKPKILKPRESKQIKRRCETCAHDFTVAQSVVASTSNSSARFCSRPCYHAFLASTPRVRGRGSRWATIARTVRSETPFCAMCGTTRSLQIHHITPFRLTRDNSPTNLVPLCVKHHREIETLTCEFERAWPDQTGIDHLGTMIRMRQVVTRRRLGKIVARALA